MISQEKLNQIVGPANVSQDVAILESYSKDMSFVNPIKPAYVVKPKDRKTVQELVIMANETNTPLVPISSGFPHFRGDTVPGVAGAVIVDLSGMNKILNVDRPRRVAMVEAGVTFAELISETRKQGLRINMPLLPRSSKTVLGSMLEREPVMMPKYQWDIEDPMACIEVIFGNGEEFRTGQAAGPGSIKEQWEVGAVQKAPAGPFIASWHRLIQGAQGTMGIVTWASLRCEILPSLEEAYTVCSDSLDQLIKTASWLIRFRMVNECFILNNTNLATIMAKNWPEDYSKLKASLPPWTLFYVLAGYEFYPEERISSNIKTISEIAQRVGVAALKSVGPISAEEIKRTIQKPSSDPFWKLCNKGACEDIFFLTTNNKVEDLVVTMNGQADKAGYAASDIGVYIQPAVQGTCIHTEFNLFYDPLKMNEVNQVRSLSTQATASLMARGAFFSRPYGENTRMIMNRDAASVAVLNKLKNLFDPNKIMNPGKICW
jgi:FAD/FMN-containing dehydrogenase